MTRFNIGDRVAFTGLNEVYPQGANKVGTVIAYHETYSQDVLVLFDEAFCLSPAIPPADITGKRSHYIHEIFLSHAIPIVSKETYVIE